MARAVDAARQAFDQGPWPRMTHAERAEYLRAIGEGLRGKATRWASCGPASPALSYAIAQYTAGGMAGVFDFYAGLATTFPFEERMQPTMGGEFGLLVREPVGVVGAIIPWNATAQPHHLQGRPGPARRVHRRPQVLARGARRGLPLRRDRRGDRPAAGRPQHRHGDREVSELLVRNPGVDKITFTGSTAAGRRIASLCGERIARCTLELGGKSAAVILDDMDLETRPAPSPVRSASSPGRSAPR